MSDSHDEQSESENRRSIHSSSPKQHTESSDNGFSSNYDHNSNTEQTNRTKRE